MVSDSNLGSKKLRFLVYSSWLVATIFQSYFTELIGDEAYYWEYSRFLSWGYFDHPPVIALLIKTGYALFSNELGVRLLPVLFGLGSLYGLEKLIAPSKPELFYALAISIGIFHFIGFLAIPDSPFLLFCVWFYMLLKQFIEQPDRKSSILLGLVCGLLILSKYHGVLVIGFALLPNLNLLKRPKLWLVAFLCLVILIPHLLWQIENDFPTFKYHLLERSETSYSIRFTMEYMASQLFVLGPICGLLFFYTSWKAKPKNQFEKTLKFSFWACLLFFLIMTFKGRVESHWTLFAMIPALYLGYGYIEPSEKLRRFIFKQFPVSLILIFLARIVVVFQFLPHDIPLVQYGHAWQNKANTAKIIAAQSGGIPVVFLNSYKNAALYSFYSGNKSMSLNNQAGRKNQYDIWNYEDSLRGKRVMVIFNYKTRVFDTLHSLKNYTEYTIIDDFQSYSKVKVIPDDLPKQINAGDSFLLNLTFRISSGIRPSFSAKKQNRSYMYYHFKQKRQKEIIKKLKPKIMDEMVTNGYQFQIEAPAQPGKYKFWLSIKTGWFPNTFNSNKYSVEIVN